MVTQSATEVKRAEYTHRAGQRAASISVMRVSSSRYNAQSATDPRVWYSVLVDPEWGEPTSCTCPAWRRFGTCKHAIAAERDWYAEWIAAARVRLADSKLRPEARRLVGLSA